MNSQKRSGGGPLKRPGTAAPKGSKAAATEKKVEAKAPIVDDLDIDKLISTFLQNHPKKQWTTAELACLDRTEFASILEALTENIPVPGLQAALSLNRGVRTPLERFNSLYSNKIPKGCKKIELNIVTTSAVERKALVELLPDSLTDLATIGTMLYPQENNDLARKLLRYFGAFSLAYGEGWKEINITQFHDVLEDVLSQRGDEEEAMVNLNEIVEEVNQRIFQADEWEQQVEVLKREHCEKTDLIFQLRQELSKEEEVMGTEKMEFQEKERDVQRMRNKIDAVKDKLAKAEAQLVPDLANIQHKIANGEAKKAALTEEKKKIEEETADLELKREKFSNLSERIGKFSMWLTEIVEKMHQLADLDSQCEFMKEELQSLMQEKKLIEEDIAKATKQESKEQLRVNHLLQEAEKRMMEIELEISGLQDKISLIKNEVEVQKQSIEQCEVAIAQNLETYDEYWNEFVENFEHLKYGLPQQANLYNLALRRIAQAHVANVSRIHLPPRF